STFYRGIGFGLGVAVSVGSFLASFTLANAWSWNRVPRCHATVHEHFLSLPACDVFGVRRLGSGRRMAQTILEFALCALCFVSLRSKHLTPPEGKNEPQ